MNGKNIKFKAIHDCTMYESGDCQVHKKNIEKDTEIELIDDKIRGESALFIHGSDYGFVKMLDLLQLEGDFVPRI